MKKVFYSCITVACIVNLAVAGGDIAPVEPGIEVPVVSEGGLYSGIALSGLSSRGNSVSMDIFSVKAGQDRLGNVTFQGGYEFNPYIAVEGRYTTTFAKEDYVEMDGWSLFVKPQYPVNENFTIYALLGYGNVNLDSSGNLPVDVDESGFQWGIGASYDVVGDIEIFFDYTMLANGAEGIYWNGDTSADVDAFTLGVTYHF